ncbi:MAG: hypothetical protein NUW01_12490 [Gemmatimonadaceae bacterium]|nr:hypothetical protein [Gemmatimonadaceae bacterium]
MSRAIEHRGQPTTRYGMPSFSHSDQIAANVVDGSAAVMRGLIEGGDYPTGEDGRSAVSTLVAAYASHENGHQAVDPRAVDEMMRQRVFPWA